MLTTTFHSESSNWNINMLLEQEDDIDIEIEDDEYEEEHSAENKGNVRTPDINVDIFNEEHTAVSVELF